MVEVAQYRARPLGKLILIKANIKGIITSIICPWARCWGSAVTGVVIFCCIHIAAPTRTARNKSGMARSSQKKLRSSGTWEKTDGQVE